MKREYLHNPDKPPVHLVPVEALLAEAKVLGFGAVKHGLHDWRRGLPWSEHIRAGLSHFLKWLNGEDRDPESGLSHLAHARCRIGFLITYQELGLGTDDRWATVGSEEFEGQEAPQWVTEDAGLSAQHKLGARGP